MEPQKRPAVPLYLDCHDVALIEGKSIDAARKRLTWLKKQEGLSKSDKLSIWRYCQRMKIDIAGVIPFYLRVLIAAATISIGFAFAKMALEYSCEYFRKHKMHIEENTPTHLKAHTFIYDPQTKRMEKTTITIDKIK